MLSLFTYSARQKRTNVMTPKTFATLRKLQLKKFLKDLEMTGFSTKHGSTNFIDNRAGMIFRSMPSVPRDVPSAFEK